MSRLSLFVIVVGLALASHTSSASGQPATSEKAQSQTVVTVTSNKNGANQSEQQANSCPGSQYPKMDCAAISAQMALEQARQAARQANQSVRQGDLFRTEIVISFMTMFAAIAAAIFAARAATAARDTVNAFTKVERADLIISLGNFREESRGGDYDVLSGTVSGATDYLLFDIVANNIGRSSALITSVTTGWCESSDPANPIFTGAQRHYIVQPGTSEVLKVDWVRPVESLRDERFLLVNVGYKSALRGRRLIQVAFEVLGVHSNIQYREQKHEDNDFAELFRSAPSMEKGA